MNGTNLKSILLVDDDEISNLFNKIFISKLDLDSEVHVALNGKEALEFLKRKFSSKGRPFIDPCLLLLDIRMPIMDGWTFLDAYQNILDDEVKKDIIVIVLTTSEDERDMARAAGNRNIKAIVKKPLSEKKFKKIIKKYFTGKKLV